MKNLTPEEQVKEAIRQQMLDWYLAIDSDGNFIHAPGSSVKHLKKTDPARIKVENDELAEFIELAFEIKIPRKKIEPTHKAPFDFIADLYFERIKNALGFANRNGGKTMGVAILNFLDLLFKKDCEVASAGAVLDQANKCYRYFIGFLRKPWFKRFSVEYKKKTGKDFLRKSLQSWTAFENNSSLEVITGSERGLRSPHPHKARIDEIDLLDWSVLQTALSMARSTTTIRGQNVFTSTRQLARGSMQKMLDTAQSKGIEIYEWNVWEIIEKCNRICIDDPEYGTCPIYEYCKGKAHHCEGFYSIDDFIDKVRLIDKDTWETEWLNLKPSRQKLVYHKFDSNVHVMTPQKLMKLFGVSVPSNYWYRIAGMDFGSGPGHPTVYLKLFALPNGAWLVYYEYYAEQRLMRDHATAIKKSPFYLPGEYIYADWAAQERFELKSNGVRTKQASKDVLTGIDTVQTLFAGFPPRLEPMLYVWHECSQLIEELGMYQWPLKSDGTPDRTGLPLKRWDHGPDALRYALHTFKGDSKQRYSGLNIPGI